MPRGTHDPFRRKGSVPVPVLALGRDLAEGPVAVLAVVDRYPPKVNAGAEWMLHAMLRDLVRRGHSVTVATGCTDEAFTLDGVEVVPAKLVEDQDAELVVGHLAWTREAITEARRREVPLVYLVHNDSQVRFWRLTFRDVSAMVWNSEWIAMHGRALSEMRQVPSTIVRPPLVVEDYDVESSREYVTLVNPIAAKGAGVFYGLAQTFPERRFLAVEGAYGSQMRPPPRVNNVAWQNQTGDIAGDVLARTRVLVAPSSYESWGRAAVEALAAGIPVIASPTPGLVEACGDAAIYADHRRQSEWNAALQSLDDPDVYAAAVDRARARAAQLEELAAVDFARFERLVLLAAGATRVRSGAMGTRRYDPFASKTDTPRPAKVAAPVEEPTDPWGDKVASLLDTIRNHGPGGPVIDVRLEANVGTDEAEDWQPLSGVSAGDTDDPTGLTDEWIVDLLLDEDAAVVLAAENITPIGYRAIVTFDDESTQTITSPTLPIAGDEAPAEEPETPADGEPGTEGPDEEVVPTKASDLVAWLGTADTHDEALRRADLAEAAETARGGDPRASVVKAIAKARTAPEG